METRDSIELLKECDSGVKMGVASIDEVIGRVNDTTLKDLLSESKRHHEQLGNEIHCMLHDCGYQEKDPNPVAQSMAWVKTNMKMAVNESDATIANLITDGCNTGVKSLNQYLNKYENADHQSQDICHRLISIEEKLCDDLQKYL